MGVRADGECHHGGNGKLERKTWRAVTEGVTTYSASILARYKNSFV
jgi:hypothetical protein